MKIVRLGNSSGSGSSGYFRIRKVAFTPDQNRKKIESIEKDIKDVNRKLRSLESDVKSLMKTMDSLNIGQRRFWQQQTIFTSLQRKLERLDKLEDEWKKFKKEMDEDMKREVEKKTRAQISQLGPNM